MSLFGHVAHPTAITQASNDLMDLMVIAAFLQTLAMATQVLVISFHMTITIGLKPTQ